MRTWFCRWLGWHSPYWDLGEAARYHQNVCRHCRAIY